MGMFSGIEKANASRNSEYLRAGRYLLYVKKFKGQVARSKANQAVLEFSVVSVLDSSAASAEPLGPHRVGDTVAWIMDLAKDASMPSLKAALAVMVGCPPEEITDETTEQLASAANPLEGLFVEFDNRIVPMVKKQGTFTKRTARRRWSKEEVDKTVPLELLKSLRIDTERA